MACARNGCLAGADGLKPLLVPASVYGTSFGSLSRHRQPKPSFRGTVEQQAIMLGAKIARPDHVRMNQVGLVIDPLEIHPMVGCIAYEHNCA